MPMPVLGAVSQTRGEFAFSAGDFERIAAMLRADAGISLPASKAALVYSRLAKRLRALGLQSFDAYCAMVAGKDGAHERQQMVSALTTNVTRFFREPHHFCHLETQILPPLLEVARRGGRVRLWSAACSSGEEPYSMALTVLRLMPDAAGHDIRVLATDIDPEILARGQAGVYAGAALAPVPADLRRRWFMPDPVGTAQWRVSEALRQLVSFRPLNLTRPWPMRGPFDAVMCRNVAIYFDAPTQATLWSQFAPLIAPKGTLYIGHSERLEGPAVSSFVSDGITTYRRRGTPR